jgi:DNA-binding SARP family transcriptional activator/basic membrane lipoprotein Med (substrate-binding protein (PBP1-ABC) superfamily)
VETDRAVLEERHFPGRQGRLVFACLVTEHGRPVPRDELAEVLWEDAPPATWEKALSLLVSKLRAVLAENGVDGARALTAPAGCYRLDLPVGSSVDVLEAENATNEAEALLTAENWEQAATSATRAESVLRGPFLPGDDGTWVDGKRRELAEVHTRALSALADASLRSGKPEQSVHWAEQAIEAEPFRESGYRRLMVAHAAAGNRAEALQVYERCRRLLAEELGAYPSPETESVYRSLLEAPSARAAADIAQTMPPPAVAAPGANRRTRPALVAGVLVAVVAVAAAAAAFTIVATRNDGSHASSAASTTRVALVVPRSPPVGDDPSAQYEAAFARARNTYGVRTQTFEIDLRKPGLPRHVRASIGNFDLVLLAGQFVDARFLHEMGRHPHTHFVVMDPDPNAPLLGQAVGRLPNATDVFFVEGPGAYLAGYLSVLMAERGHPGKHVEVSVVAGDPNLSVNQIAGFTMGAEAASPHADVLTDYSYDSPDPSVCQAIANRQIDQGSTAVFADAGACSIGAMSAAGTRRVWGIGADEDKSYVGPQILVSTVKRLDRAVDYAIRSYLDGTLPQGHLDIGIERGAVDITGINPVVPPSILAAVEREKQRRMKHWASLAMPLR